jgi:SAM-dependent methyltransferase
MNHQTSCILCGDPGGKTVVDTLPVKDLIQIYARSFRQYDFQNELKHVQQDILLLQCTHCDLLFFWPDAAGSDRFYEYLQQFDWYYSTDKNEFSIARQYISPDADVLEIGSGSGFFAQKLKSKSYTGLEFNDESIRNAAKNGITLTREFVEDHAEKFPGLYDIACAFQVLEHVSAPGRFLSACIKSLKTGGKLIVSIPSADSYAAWFPNHNLNLPPHHVTLWTDQCFSRIADIFNLKLVNIHHDTCDERELVLYLNALLIQGLNRITGSKNKMIEVSFLSKLKHFAAARAAALLLPAVRNNPAFPSRGQSVTVVYEKN